jgi:hypothetical protein
VARTFVARLLSVSRLNFVVDVGLFVASVTVMVSGIMVAPALLEPLGVHFTPTYAWHLVHSWSADATIVLFALHAALHWRWALGVVKRMAADPARSVPSAEVLADGAGSALARPVAARGTRTRRDRAAQAAKERASFVRGLSLVGVTALASAGVVLVVGVAGPLLLPRSAAARVALAAKSGASPAGICPTTGCTATKCHGSSGAAAATFYSKAQIAAGMKASKGGATAPKVAANTKRGAWKAPANGIRSITLPRPHGTVALIAPPAPRRRASPAATPGSGGRSTGSGNSGGVAAGSGSGSGSSAKRSVATSSGTQTCPRTGCTASSCHGAAGQSAASFYH